MIVPYQADALAKIFSSIAPPYRVTETHERTIIYEFWRVDSTNRSAIHDKSVRKELALVTVDRRAGTFNLAYYPLDKQIQFMTALPLENLTQVIEDLKLAGF